MQFLLKTRLRLVVDVADLFDDELEVVVGRERVGGGD